MLTACSNANARARRVAAHLEAPNAVAGPTRAAALEAVTTIVALIADPVRLVLATEEGTVVGTSAASTHRRLPQLAARIVVRQRSR